MHTSTKVTFEMENFQVGELYSQMVVHFFVKVWKSVKGVVMTVLDRVVIEWNIVHSPTQGWEGLC